jgi:hypothetical protein
MIRVGDVVQKLDAVGSGTGILFQVTSISEEREYNIGTSRRRKKLLTKKLKIKPIIVLFNSKSTKNRNTITYLECNVKKVDIVDIASELNKLHLFLQDEVKRLGA